MARARNIKPGLFKNELLGVADPLFTLLFEGLWVLADREGRLEDRPLRIKAEVFPYRDGLSVEDGLNWLQSNGFILRYKVGTGSFIQILNFGKHQSPHKNEVPSEIPAPDKNGAVSSKIGTDSDKAGTTRADCFNLIPDSLNPIDAPADADADPWLVGKEYLVKRGLTPSTVGAFIGKLVKDHGKENVVDALQNAIVNEPADVKSYINGLLRNKKSGNTKSPPWWSSDASIQAKGRELGMTPSPGESWQQFRGRINARLEAN